MRLTPHGSGATIGNIAFLINFLDTALTEKNCPLKKFSEVKFGQCSIPDREKMMDRHRLRAERKEGDGGSHSQLVLDSRTKTRKPSMYKVLMMNDDYTPMEFVVHVLQHFFNLTNSQANAIMLNVHQRGIGVCGVYSYEVAEAKATKVMEYARQNEHPLQLQLEKE